MRMSQEHIQVVFAVACLCSEGRREVREECSWSRSISFRMVGCDREIERYIERERDPSPAQVLSTSTSATSGPRRYRSLGAPLPCVQRPRDRGGCEGKVRV